MAWEIITNRGAELDWAHWLDLDAARAWQRRLRALQAARIDYSDHYRPGLDAPDVFPRLMAWLRDCFEAASQLLRALNQPAAACPYYVAALRGQVGNEAAGVFGAWTRDALPMLLLLSREARARVRPDPSNPRVEEVGFVLTVYPRVYLTVRADVDARLLLSFDPPDPASGAPDTWGCNTPGWGFGRFCYKAWWPGALDAAQLGDVTAIATVSQNIALMHAFCLKLATVELTELVTRSRIYVAAKNIAEARRFGGTRVEDIETIRSAADVLNATVSDESRQIGTYGRAIGLAVGAVVPVVGAIIAGLASVPELLEGFFGRAVGRSIDVWGRVEPVYEPAIIGGTIGRDRQTPPDYVVPMPPPLVWSSYGPRVAPPPGWVDDAPGGPVGPADGDGRPVVPVENSVWYRNHEDWGRPLPT